MKQPRYYQQEAYKAIVESIGNGQIPYASMCTGSGKSLVLAMLTRQALKQKKRVLQIVPTKELCQQNYSEAVGYVENPAEIGVCCAKIGRFETYKPTVIATHTSLLRRRANSGGFDLCLIDECHLVTPDDNTSYRKIIRSLLRINPSMKIAGVTATPYRMDQGKLEDKCFKGEPLFTNQCYETNIARLIEEGYLSHVESISGDVEIDTSGLKVSGNDYNTEAMGVKFDEIVENAVKDMRLKFEQYNVNTALIFASTLYNARRIMNEWNDETMLLMHGDMSNHDRIHAINWIKRGIGKRYIVNVGILTTGFDYTALDCVVLMRATMSLGLYIQMCGRVIRSHDDKEKGYVLDYGTNIERHGPIDATIPPKKKLRRGDMPKKQCMIPLCGHMNLISAKFCRECGAEFIIENEDGNYSMRSKAEILSVKLKETEEYHDITSVIYEKAYSKKDGTPMIKMRLFSFGWSHNHYICVEHPGSAGCLAKQFLIMLFKDREDLFDLGEELTVDNLLILLDNYPEKFKKVKSITTSGTGKFKQLTKVVYD